MRNDGLDEWEGQVMDLSCEMFNAYGRLPVQHPTDMRDVADAVHRVQDLLAVRACRRAFPEGWPDKGNASDA